QWLEVDRGQYDLVFCDPPTFSNSKRAGDFDVQASHVRLLRAAVARLAPGGVLYFSNNFRRFRLDAEAIAAFASCEDISAATIPPDFARNPRIHRCRAARRTAAAEASVHALGVAWRSGSADAGTVGAMDDDDEAPWMGSRRVPAWARPFRGAPHGTGGSSRAVH